ncbi:type II secretion system protein [Pedobacter montanisoli]|uniref:Type II secretion system GspH family protein n=1 Tax=Pedobacter montanisoli TaxID=2923277 RepID=A0ABS9ZZF5_9SPHI|nr:type II secretion system protein [Pedobacter montanisoli]MCJ0743684.1 type II secretion system GspH family protein [Pedobacter montanisoli]
MAGIMHKKLKASTLIEVLIAMVIIVVIFTVAMRVFSNVLNTGISFKKIQVQNQLEQLAQEVKQQGYLKENELLLDSISYRFRLTDTETPGIAYLEIKAAIRNKNVGIYKCLLQRKEPDEKN